MTGREWSLAGRLTRIFLLSTSIFVLAISISSGWFLERSVNRELSALAQEELEELEVLLEHTPADRAVYEEITAKLASQHSANALAWRVWRDGESEVWELGATELLSEHVPSVLPHDQTMRGRDGVRWRTHQLPLGQTVGLALDGSPQIALLRRYAIFAGALVLASLAFTLIAGRFFFQRVSRLLHEVAQRARSVRDPAGGVRLDIADAPREVREVVDALDEMLENIRREMAQNQVFTAGLAHELRSPVQNLVGETEVALIADRSAEHYKRVLHSHLDELHRLGDAVDNLIAICSSRAARSSRAREDFDLGEEADIRLRRERGLAERRGVHFQLSTSGDLRLFGDREALLRALRNLVANAIEWSDAGGRVEVALAGHPSKVVITVDDAGPGVPEELRERIFEPFFSSSNEPQRRPGSSRRAGYGLGLGMVHSAVENHGGTVDIGTSRLGGARFEVELPREASPQREAEPETKLSA